MSKYTTEVRYICESESGLEESVGYDNVNAVIASAIPKIFSFDFPIFDEAYRPVLCGKILKHYYTREIGAETYGRWKLFLDARMNEIMPYFNDLYKSAEFEFDPLTDIDLVTNHGGTLGNTGTIETTNNNTKETSTVTNVNSSNSGRTINDSHNYYSDTPQGKLSNVEDGEYLTTATFNGDITDYDGSDSSATSNVGTDTVNGTGSETRNLTTTDNYLHTVKGKSGGVSYSKMLMEYRKSLINIDNMIINELADLFINIY